MKAENLYLKDGKPTRVWYCTTCRTVSQTQEAAEACCRPAVCESCGQEMSKPQYWHKCDKCRQAEFESGKIAKEVERYAAAKKVTEFEGWVYCESIGGHNEGFFESLQELIDFCQDEEALMPDYCWACNAISFVHLDISNALADIEENGYEDFDADECNRLDELKKAATDFNEANKRTVKYEPNYDLAVILPPEVVFMHKALMAPVDDARGGKE
jgi:hypothetical protein